MDSGCQAIAKETLVEPSRFAYIDSTRGLAFLLVLAVHTFIIGKRFHGDFLFANGASGVQLFFLASAITLCFSMSSRRNQDEFPIAFFYIRRVFRIAPMFYLAMIFYRSLPSIVVTADPNSFASPDGVGPVDLILNALFLHGLSPYAFNSVVPGGWSVGVEMNFYILFPIIFKFIGNSVRRSLTWFLWSIPYSLVMLRLLNLIHQHFCPSIRDGVWGFFVGLCLPMQLPVFILGFLIHALICHPTIVSFLRQPYWSKSMLLLSAMLMVTLFRGFNTGFIPFGLLIVMSFALFILSRSHGGGRIIANPLLIYLGKISYSCYLIHFASLGLAMRILNLHIDLSHPQIDAGGSIERLVLFAKIFSISLLITVVLSTITERYIEKTGIALGKKLLRAISWRNEMASIDKRGKVPLES